MAGTNIWALDKHESIKHLLLMLEHHFASNSYVIDTNTPTDPCAIFLCHRNEPGMRAYLYTLGQGVERYGVQLEFPSSAIALETYENLTFNYLTEILGVHLDSMPEESEIIQE